jgi:hypothetical protein
MTSTSNSRPPRRISIPGLLNRHLLFLVSLLIVIAGASQQTPQPEQQEQQEQKQLDDKDDAQAHPGRSKRFAYHTQVWLDLFLLSFYQPFLSSFLFSLSLSPFVTLPLSPALPFTQSLNLPPSLSNAPWRNERV